MPTIGITDLAHSLRKNTLNGAVPIGLSHGQQLISAGFGRKTLAAYKAAVNAKEEPEDLAVVRHVVLNLDLLNDRLHDLNLNITSASIEKLVAAAFKERLPQTQVHRSEEALADALREQAESAIDGDPAVTSAMSDANHEGIDYTDVEFEADFAQATFDEPLVVLMEAQVVLNVDTERPYSGNKVKVKASLTLSRLGRGCYGAAEVEIQSAHLDDGYARPPMRTLAQKLADELGIELSDAQELADAEAQPLTGNSGETVYSYLFDFADYASPELAKMLMETRGSLQLEVDVNFFDDVYPQE